MKLKVTSNLVFMGDIIADRMKGITTMAVMSCARKKIIILENIDNRILRKTNIKTLSWQNQCLNHQLEMTGR